MRTSDVERAGRTPAVSPWWILTDRGILTVAAAITAVGIVALIVMLQIASNAGPADRPSLQLEAVKFGLGFVAAAGAVVALLLGIRRQQLSEQTYVLELRKHEQLREIELRKHEHAERDAIERRVTELYAKAIEQLGSPRAAVRLGAMFALERVAQDNISQRPTVIGVLCAYLRMPYDPAAGDDDVHGELQVRRAAQDLLCVHLAVPSDVDTTAGGYLDAESRRTFWPGCDLDLAGATLIDWRLSRAYIRKAVFTRARFIGTSSFRGMAFARDADFNEASFEGLTDFGDVTFTGDVGWRGARVASADFAGARFLGDVDFQQTRFSGDTDFRAAYFAGSVTFAGAEFTGELRMDEVQAADDGPRLDTWPERWSLRAGEQSSAPMTLVRKAA
ncbi:pentapeptide repeat-containing protein [Actinoplanes sp. NPDC051633]|uniref:pentapeptide repeat-containing protein n=1 Tax=Actinoplanes sp. NPDC051633 TaxID=3155670 RepID=UPI00343EDFCC